MSSFNLSTLSSTLTSKLSKKIGKKFSAKSWLEFCHLLNFAQRRLREERLSQVAGSLTFTTSLALVPMITIALALLTAFPWFNSFRTSLEGYFVKNLIPENIANTIFGYLNLFSSKATGLSAIGIVALMVTAVMMISTVDRVFNQIWRVKTTRPLMQRLLIYWAIITLGPLLVGASITTTSYFLNVTHGILGRLPWFSVLLYAVISVGLTAIAFTLLYLSVPNRAINTRDAVLGGILAAIVFEVAKRLFATFVLHFSSYTMIYGALAAVPIFLMWIYLSWFIILAGAVFVAALPTVKYERWWHVSTPGTTFVDAMALLQVLYQAKKTTLNGMVDIASLRVRTQLGFDEMDSLLQKMRTMTWVECIKIEPQKGKHLRWVKRVVEEGGNDHWVLLANPAQLTLAKVYRLFMFDTLRNETLVRQVEEAIERGLQESLATYFSD